jgi:hypothetical protein
MSTKKRSSKGQFIAAGKQRATKAVRVASPPKKRKRARRNPDAAPAATGGMLAAVANPPDMSELAEFILPGFAGYGATKMLSRIVYTQLSKKWPGASKHVAVGSTVISFLAAWMLLHRIKKLAPYQMPATVGAGIAALQTIVSQYLPKYGWMVSDITMDSSSPLLSSGAQRASMPSGAPVETLFPGGPEVVGDDEDDVLVTDGIGDIDLGSLGGGTVESYADAN